MAKVYNGIGVSWIPFVSREFRCLLNIFLQLMKIVKVSLLGLFFVQFANIGNMIL